MNPTLLPSSLPAFFADTFRPRREAVVYLVRFYGYRAPGRSINEPFRVEARSRFEAAELALAGTNAALTGFVGPDPSGWTSFAIAVQGGAAGNVIVAEEARPRPKKASGFRAMDDRLTVYYVAEEAGAFVYTEWAEDAFRRPRIVRFRVEVPGSPEVEAFFRPSDFRKGIPAARAAARTYARKVARGRAGEE